MNEEKCDICGKMFKKLAVHKRMAHPETLNAGPVNAGVATTHIKEASPEEIRAQGLPETGIRPATVNEAAQVDPMYALLSGLKESLELVVKGQQDLSKRVKTIETGGKYAFKDDAKEEDIEKGRQDRESVSDPRIAVIIDELLGEDFGIKLEKFGDKPGYMFSVIVPPRLSPRGIAQRPIRKEDPKHSRDYKKDEKGNVVMEDYYPEDLRSRAMTSVDSYDVVRRHCQKVQANIIAWHQKLQKPIPEFKVK